MKWTKIEKGLPDAGQDVLVYVEYLNKNKPESAIFVGYMDEYGGLHSKPDDEDYGWEFHECVTHWMPLPEPPKQ